MVHNAVSGTGANNAARGTGHIANVLRIGWVLVRSDRSTIRSFILIPSFREFSDRYVNPCPRSFLPLDADGVPRVDLASVSLHES